MINFKGGLPQSSETVIKLALLLVASLAAIALFMDGGDEPDRPEGLVQILPYTLHDAFDSEADASKEWRVEFILPPELKSEEQALCDAFVGGEQYIALSTIKAHSQNGATRFAPVWLRKDSSSSGHYRCDLNVNGTNIPWQVPQAELDEINFRNRNKMPL